MLDESIKRFLKRQRAEGLALSEASEILTLEPEPGEFPQHYRAEFACRGLVKDHAGNVVEAGRFTVHIFFPHDYLRRSEIPEVLSWLGPRNVFHPNIRVPFVCTGRITPATPLQDLIYQVFEIIVYRKFNPREDDSLNREACSWARNHQERFPIDPRPLKTPRRPTPSPSAGGHA